MRAAEKKISWSGGRAAAKECYHQHREKAAGEEGEGRVVEEEGNNRLVKEKKGQGVCVV